ncbi:PASTA domain-containing protein [Gryllotalpicola reticulitermitis]|uniref:PASTA domain-containing protein n=1 Tax=Gryllotalpicola reticulitermitis TaxID=1184153 RepID=A0ABV8Q340_9MICO
MADRSTRRIVTVPDVVGLPFHVGRDAARDAGVTLANPDPDGPPIGALAWPGLYYIVSQEPAPGVQLHEHDSVRVQIIKHGDDGDREPAVPLPVLPVDAAHATPETEQHVDLADDEAARDARDPARERAQHRLPIWVEHGLVDAAGHPVSAQLSTHLRAWASAFNDPSTPSTRAARCWLGLPGW